MAVDTVFVNSQINIRSTLESIGAEFHRNRSKCVIHGGDNPTSLEIFDDGRAYTCHSHSECCRFGHDGIGLLRALNNWTMAEVGERYQTNPQPIDPKEAARRAADNAERIQKDLERKIQEAQKAVEELRKARRWMDDHDNMSAQAIAEWERRGVPEMWQSWFWFGYRENFSYAHDGQYYTSPSLTIPIFDTTETDPVQVRHRILNPISPADKYRPEKAGIEALPFLGDRSLPIEAADRVIIVEGEIKAAVTFLTLDRPLWQVVGIPGKQIWGKLAPQLQGRKDTVILLDPDAKPEAEKMAKSLGGALVVNFPRKIDDAIIEYGLDKDWLDGLFRTGKLVK